MSSKVVLRKEAADAIEAMKAKGESLAEIVKNKISCQLTMVNGWDEVTKLDNDILIRALYIGYEVEKEETHREKVGRFLQKFYGYPASDIVLTAIDGIYEGVKAE